MLNELTRMPVKAAAYQADTYYREAAADVERQLGADAVPLLRRAALLMIKPDGRAAGVSRTVLDWLAERGFTVVHAVEVDFTRRLWNDLWRYQLNSATVDRLLVNELVLAGPASLLVLRDATGAPLPATVRLAGEKGSADLSQQRPGTLRSLLRQPSRMLSYIHVADEPADLVREVGLLLPRADRRRLWRAIAEPEVDPAVAGAVDRLVDAAATERYDFDLAGCRARVDAALDRAPLDRAGSLAPLDRAGSLAAVRAWLTAADSGAPPPWPELLAALDGAGVSLARWDLALLGASYVQPDLPGASKQIGNADPAEWANTPAGGGQP